MRVVHVGFGLPADTRYLELLAEDVNLVVYHARGLSPDASTKRLAARARDLSPYFQPQRNTLSWIYRGLTRALAEDRPDVVHVVSEPWGLVPMQLARWCARNRVALITHGCDRIWWHGGRFERRARRSFASSVLRRSAGFAAESEAAIARARETGLPAAAPTAVIHTNPRDPTVFRPSTAHEKLSARRVLGLPETGIGIGFLGQLIPRKAPDLFLRALARIEVEGTWAAIGGRGTLEPYVKEEARRVKAHYLGALSFPIQVAQFYRAIDVFVVPSVTTADWDDQAPRSVIESMMSSCIVVGSTCGSIPAMLGDAGIVFEENNLAGLTEAIRAAVASIPDRSMHARARESAAERYSSQSAAAQLLDLWRESLRAAGRKNG